MLNVTNDASRVADLLEEFLSQYSSDPQIKTKFLVFMAEQADTKYSVVDNKLNWVLWLYSLVWMPLLVLMCLTRMGKSSSSSSHEAQRHSQHVPTASMAMNGSMPPPHIMMQQQGSGGGGYPSSPGPAAGDAAGLSLNPTSSGPLPEHSPYSTSSTLAGAGSTPRQRRTVSTGGSLDLPPRYSVPGSFGRPPLEDAADCSTTRSAAAAAPASSNGRSLRSAMGSITERQRVRASSDRTHMSRPSKLQASSSLPQHNNNNPLLASRGMSSGGFKGGAAPLNPGGAFGGQQQGFDPRLAAQGSSGGGYVAEYAGHAGSNGSGADVRTAAAVDQAVAGGDSSGMWSKQGLHHQSMGSPLAAAQ